MPALLAFFLSSLAPAVLRLPVADATHIHLAYDGLSANQQQFFQHFEDDQAEEQTVYPAGEFTWRARGDSFGEALETGDFNRDGKDDLVIAAPDENAPGTVEPANTDYDRLLPGNGAVTVLYGSGAALSEQAGPKKQRFTVDNDGRSETNTPTDSFGGPRFGRTLAAGDFDGDGFDDLAIGSRAGYVVVLYGGGGGLTSAGSAYVAQDGSALDAGDIDNDGKDDLVVGAPAANNHAGLIRVFYGGPRGNLGVDFKNQLIDQATGGDGGVDGHPESRTSSFRGDQFGASVAVGHFNAGPAADVAIGIPGEEGRSGGGGGHGAVAILYGSDVPGGLISASTAQYFDQNEDGIEGGPETNDRFGESLAAGDLDQNGIEDLAIGVPGEDFRAGAVAVLYGQAPGLSAGGNELIQQGQWVEGYPWIGGAPEPDDEFGAEVEIGQFDAHGPNDIAIGIPGEDGGAGAVHVIYAVEGLGVKGRSDRYWDQVWDQSAAGGRRPLDNGRFGQALGAGDFNGDRADDLAIGLPLEDAKHFDGAPQFGYAGAVAVLLGGKDSTPPTITPVVTGQQGLAGWYVTDVSVNWQVTDAESAILTTQGCGFNKVTTDTAGVTFRCTATSRGGTTVAEITLKRDATPPVVNVVQAPSPNAAGWNNSDVTVDFECSDAMSGVAHAECPGHKSVQGETSGQTLSEDVKDNAGNSSPVSATVRIDKTPPKLKATRDSAPNQWGWYNTDVTVTWDCQDSLSGVGGCTLPETLIHDGKGIYATGMGLDRAGNEARVTEGPINIDKTAPTIAANRSVAPNADGWNNTDVTVSYQCQDPVTWMSPDTSGISGCSGPQTVAAEGANQSTTGTATDYAGNVAAVTEGPINIDKTAPQITAKANPDALTPPDHRLVYVDVTVSVTDALAGASGFLLESALSSEPDDAPGVWDGATKPDIVDFELGKPDITGRLRAERDLTGPGRVYTLTYVTTDLAGNTGRDNATVVVPNQRPGSPLQAVLEWLGGVMFGVR